MNAGREYNAPTVVRIADSLGNTIYSSGIQRNHTGAGFCRLYNRPSGILFPGDQLAIEVEIDPSFDKPSYGVKWHWRPGVRAAGDTVFIELTEKHVRPNFAVVCEVTSNESWHRMGERDDLVTITYKVLPLRS